MADMFLTAILRKAEKADYTIWLNRNQMAELFERDVEIFGKHIIMLFVKKSIVQLSQNLRQLPLMGKRIR